MTDTYRLLVGAGGHAKALVEIFLEGESSLDGYFDPKPQDWLRAAHLASREAVDALEPGEFIMGTGGVKPEALALRLKSYRSYRDAGWQAPPLVHESATVSEAAELKPGVVVLPGAVVQPYAVVGEAAIINTGAIVEHDSTIGEGTHVAPGAIVLGGCSVGRSCMIGAGSVVLQGCSVPDRTLVKALTRFPV